jgi:transcription termination/antitermination protein NusG
MSAAAGQWRVGEVVGTVLKPETPAYQGEAHWYAVHCAPRSELKALKKLRVLAVQSWCPMAERTIVPRHGKRKVIRTVERPAFPGYLFVRCSPQAWGSICDVDGVNDLVRQGDRPVAIAAKIVEDLMAVEDIGGMDDPENEIRLAVGDHVLITSGPFEGFPAVVEKQFVARAEDRERSVGLVTSLFGRETRIRVPLDKLEIVA